MAHIDSSDNRPSAFTYVVVYTLLEICAPGRWDLLDMSGGLGSAAWHPPE